MPTQVPTSYDATPYVDAVVAQTHPDRLATIATLFGISTRGVETCRVLELGCASGGNLIPMALGLPNATFVGIDLSARQIAQGQEKVQTLELKNIELRHGNITDIDASLGQFDYIVCHGMYSWVPEPVREKILAICRENLAPQGVAYVSYNTFPGWHMIGMVRDMMIFHVRQFEDPPTKVRQARALIAFLAKSVPADTPYGMMLGQLLDATGPRSDADLFHDILEEINDPVYFHQFVESAARHGLQYLAEADFGNSIVANLPRPIADTLREIAPDTLRMEQYMDFVRNCSFRRSLLTHQGISIRRNLEGNALQGLSVASAAQYESRQPSLAQGVTEAFCLPNGSRVTPSTDITKATLLVLTEQWPLAVPFDQLVAASRSKLPTIAGVVPDATALAQQATVLCNELLHCYAAGVIELRTQPPRLAATPSVRPLASPLARLEAERGEVVTNLRHESLRLDDFHRRLLRLLDGGRDRDAIFNALVIQSAGGGLNTAQDGTLLTKDPQFEKALRVALDESLPMLARAGLLMN